MKVVRSLSKIFVPGILLVAVLISSGSFWRKVFVHKQLDLLKVYFPLKAEMPDPAKIENTGQWYLLGHISSSLSHFDHIDARFGPLLASIESYAGGIHLFTLVEDAKFHDGSPIVADDVVKSIKRLLVMKTSTHFPLWEYVEGCENLKSLDEDCSGIKKISDRKVEIRLKMKVADFQLQMASPETGIWHHRDISNHGPDYKITPTKFSGPYYPEKNDSSGFYLKRNPLNPISKIFSNSPKEISLAILQASQINDSFAQGKIDMAIRSHNPMDTTDYGSFGLNVFASGPATLIYLHGAGVSERQNVSRRFVENLWNGNTDNLIVAADNFLPFDPSMSISRQEFLTTLPANGAQKIKLGVPWTYLSDEFYKFLVRVGKESGMNIELASLTPKEWMEALTEGSTPYGIDYVLTIYAASERYPAVQLRYYTGKVRGPKIDLKGADTPELSREKKRLIQEYQIALLKAQYAIPLFFSKHQIVYRKGLALCDQPPSDAEVELWRITKE